MIITLITKTAVKSRLKIAKKRKKEKKIIRKAKLKYNQYKDFSKKSDSYTLPIFTKFQSILILFLIII